MDTGTTGKWNQYESSVCNPDISQSRMQAQNKKILMWQQGHY